MSCILLNNMLNFRNDSSTSRLINIRNLDVTKMKVQTHVIVTQYLKANRVWRQFWSTQHSWPE